MQWSAALVFSVCFLGSNMAGAQAIRVADLRCEYLADPLGVDAPRPRLTWVIQSDQRGQRQTAYQVLVASTPALLEQDRGDLWDNGKVASEETANVVYRGEPLASRQACHWKVRAWDRDGKPSPWSAPARWEMGLLKPDDWQAKWIAAPPPVNAQPESLAGAKWIWCPEAGVDPAKDAPAGKRFFRCRVNVPAAEMPGRASLLLSVDDEYTLFVNGRQIGRVAEADGWKHPRSYDIRPQLKPGENVVALAATNIKGPAGVCVKLAIQFPGKPPQAIVSDRTWKTSATSAKGWNSPGFDDASWKNAQELVAFGGGVWGSPSPDTGSQPVPVLRKAFALDKQVVSARLYVTALGLYEVHINGQRAGDHVLAPDWTDYRKRVRYQVYDVTSSVKQGDNVISALLGNGWYCGHIGNGGFRYFGKEPALLAQLEVTYHDGSTARIVSDDTWKTHASPILASDFFLGESYDATKMLVDGDDTSWPAAIVRSEPPRKIEAQVMPPVRVLARLKAKSLSEPKPGRWTFDLGQNMVGVVRLKVSAPKGTKITLRHAEMLNPDGTIYVTNLRGAPSVDSYICGGAGTETWQPRFTFHGFRYVELTGLPQKPDMDTITGIVIGTDTPRVGEFACSDPRINQLQSNIQWGQRGNYISIPTDCPQRDERLGWMGDAQVFVRTATMNADVAAFFTKWLVDVDDGQSSAGAFGDVSPNTMGGNSVPAWADAGVICPWTIYQTYGDRRILRRHLPAMTRWVEFCRAHSSGLIRDKNRGADYGDWLSIGADTPKDLIGTAYFAYSTDLLARSYRAVGKTEEAAKYEQLFRDIKAAFIKRYVKPDGRIRPLGTGAGNTQCCYAMALKFNLLPDELRPKAAQYLQDDIRAKGWHVSTGFVGVSYLLPVLTQAGKIDTAYRLLMQDTFPSWLFSVKHGATTIWERWDGWTPEKGFQDPGMNSFNHYALGSCGQWLFDTVAGIGLDPNQPGYKHIIIHPRVGGGLSWARASLNSIRGPIASAWKFQGGAKSTLLTLDVTIPANTTATVYVPAARAEAVQESGRPAAAAEGVKFLRAEQGEAVFEVQSGTYRFTSQ
jgi:alpha-L-rhamnosidase